MFIYKIRNKKNGLFSTGSINYSWNKHGKIWTEIRFLRLHLNLIKSYKKEYLDDIEIVIYEVNEYKNVNINKIFKDL